MTLPITITKEQTRTAAVLEVPVSFVCQVWSKCRRELESEHTYQISDDEVDEVLVERWNLLTTKERAAWWSKTTWNGSYGIAAEIKWDSTPAESTRGSAREKKST